MEILIMTLTILLIGTIAVYAQQFIAKMDITKPMAKQSLNTYKKIVTLENYSEMGFRSPDEAKIAELGKPLWEFTVHLNHLIAYTAQDEPGKLFKNTHIVYYPVEVNCKSRSMIMLAKNGDTWNPASFSNPNLIGLIAETYDVIKTRDAVSAASFFVVRIPALNMHFISYKSSSQIYLTPIYNNPNYKLTSGKTYKAEQVFEIVAPVAQKHDRVPA